MTPDHTPPAWALLLAEVTGAGVGGHAMQTLALLPGWVGGIIGGLVVGVTLRLFDPLLRAYGDRLHRRLTPPPAPPDDRTG